MRQAFEKSLTKLQDDLLFLASLVESAILEAVDSLKRRDREDARRLIAADERINERRFAIENDALTLIATQQPMAGDMRMLAAYLEIAGELERIGDYAKGIAKINLMMGDQPLIKPLVDIPVMAQKAQAMLHDGIAAFVKRDIEAARLIPLRDDEVDDLYNQVFRDLLDLIIADRAYNADQATYLLWVAHNLERTADRVINICERVVYTTTGEMIEMNGVEV